MKFFKYFFLSLIVIMSVFFIRYYFFNKNISQISSASPQQADLIVVLTGGKNRIKTGFDLLNKKVAQTIFITGVHTDVNSKDFFKNFNPEHNKNVFIGKFAKNTNENAKEFFAFNKMNNFKFKTIYLITDIYHMQRAVLEFNNINNVKIIPFAIQYETNNKKEVIIREFIKYHLASLLHLLHLEYVE